MADKKISALTAASTPLSGTEVLPIVQSGVTVKTSIANIQAAPIDAQLANKVVYLNGSKVPATTTLFAFDGTNLGVGTATPFSTNGVSIHTLATGGAPARNILQSDRAFAIQTDFRQSLFVVDQTASVERLELNSSGDFAVKSGNLVIGTNGKGIDFSSVASGIKWLVGTGSPEGVVTAAVGSLYTNSSGGLLTTLYVKESGTGNTGWVAK